MSASNVETVNVTGDRIKLGLALLFAIAGVVGFYVLDERSALLKTAVILSGLLASLLVFMLSEPGRRFVAFARDSVREAQRVTWPTRKETWQMTAIVFVFVVVMAIFLWATDKTLEWVLYDLILGWKK